MFPGGKVREAGSLQTSDPVSEPGFPETCLLTVLLFLRVMNSGYSRNSTKKKMSTPVRTTGKMKGGKEQHFIQHPEAAFSYYACWFLFPTPRKPGNGSCMS